MKHHNAITVVGFRKLSSKFRARNIMFLKQEDPLTTELELNTPITFVSWLFRKMCHNELFRYLSAHVKCGDRTLTKLWHIRRRTVFVSWIHQFKMNLTKLNCVVSVAGVCLFQIRYTNVASLFIQLLNRPAVIHDDNYITRTLLILGCC